MQQPTWNTWGHRHETQLHRVCTPHSVADVQRFVRDVVAQQGRVKVVGASRSSSAIAQPSGALMSLEYLTGATAVDAENRRATFLAGTTLRDANKILMSYGLAFENLGRLDQQTIAGAVSTGTHGTGLAFAGFSTQVTELALVTADGELLNYSPSQHPEIFDAALVGLGALGVLVSVTFRVVPLFRLHAIERGRSYQEIIPSFVERARGADHYSFSWFPGSNEVRTRRLTRLPLLTEGFMEPHARLSQARRHGGDYALNNGIFEAMNLLSTKVPATQNTLNKVSNWGKGNRRYADLAPRVFTQNRTVHYNSMEYAFDLNRFEQVMADVRKHLNSAVEQSGFPLIITTSAADNIPLSPAFERETFYITARSYWRQPFESYFATLEEVFRRHDGRPHWGQLHTLDAVELAELYPRFDEFVKIRERLDPQGVFLNPYLEKVLIR